MNNSINCNGFLLTLERPRVMGIINITDDSFYTASRAKNIDDVIILANKMLTDGADILDIGAMSSRPGAEIIPEEIELKKTVPIIKELKINFPKAIISVDTLRSSVARECIQAGAHMINDISAGSYDSAMIPTMVELGVPYVMMHMKGLPNNMQIAPKYDDVVMEILSFLSYKLRLAVSAGIKDIIIDPGIGFGKTVDHNFEILKKMEVFTIFERPILIGISRKSLICKTLNISNMDALNGSTALHMVALTKGAKLLRVHDVKEAVECVHLYEKLKD